MGDEPQYKINMHNYELFRHKLKLMRNYVVMNNLIDPQASEYICQCLQEMENITELSEFLDDDEFDEEDKRLTDVAKGEQK